VQTVPTFFAIPSNRRLMEHLVVARFWDVRLTNPPPPSRSCLNLSSTGALLTGATMRVHDGDPFPSRWLPNFCTAFARWGPGRNGFFILALARRWIWETPVSVICMWWPQPWVSRSAAGTISATPWYILCVCMGCTHTEWLLRFDQPIALKNAFWIHRILAPTGDAVYGYPANWCSRGGDLLEE
jgi:hypothetical protein